jgi:hypothetical protein
MMSILSKPKRIKLNKSTYYNATDLMAYDRAYFVGCSNSVRKIIARKAIKSDQYTYATWSEKYKWRPSTNQKKPSTKAKLLIEEEWVRLNYPKLMRKSSINKVASPPKLIKLSDNEKFRNVNGVVDIETRGKRTKEGVYFLAKDVAKAFAMPNLINTMTRKDSAYETDIHYKRFIRQKSGIPTKTLCKKQVYITYDGMLKILLASRSGVAKTFTNWASETLFTVQMGSISQKNKLISNIIGVPAKDFKTALRASAKPVACIYRFGLGIAGDLRDAMDIPQDIPDDYIIIKYGLTNDLVRRTGEHILSYEKIPGVALKLMNFAYIDQLNLSKAECDIKTFFESVETKLSYKKYNELIAVNPDHEKVIKTQFMYISTEYSGSVADLNIKLAKLKEENARLKERIILNDEAHATNISHLKEIHKLELSSKDLFIENKILTNELLQVKLSNALSKK